MSRDSLSLPPELIHHILSFVWDVSCVKDRHSLSFCWRLRCVSRDLCEYVKSQVKKLTVVSCIRKLSTHSLEFKNNELLRDRVKIEQLQNISNHIISIINCFPNLEVLNLDDLHTLTNENLEIIINGLENLKQISLCGCPFITRFSCRNTSIFSKFMNITIDPSLELRCSLLQMIRSAHTVTSYSISNKTCDDSVSTTSESNIPQQFPILKTKVGLFQGLAPAIRPIVSTTCYEFGPLVIQVMDTMPILIRNSENEMCYKLFVAPHDTAEDVKIMFQALTGIPCDSQRLEFSGRELQNNRMLYECSICKLCTMDVIVSKPTTSLEKE
ncbi:hypothetical protein FDP41_011690 [Naegleria fowleri]|uniref:Ubiquitin-like domain-containing protein n=1 Tax=Naegleria fowleri TaxID=5763 RepID=A0A6A5C968_NAEFO|nr:uncharacterized protein FDP41_011690 [Naegleria fowleri]KAF0981829.1 hypothetical protein FDP41_011690 [Naegleria fowleri]CAG4712463.1 unnamed protein product [Naegleria fowleri]